MRGTRSIRFSSSSSASFSDDFFWDSRTNGGCVSTPLQQTRGASVASGASPVFSAVSTSLPRAYVRPRARGACEVAVEAQRRSSSAHSFFADKLAAVSEERDASVSYGMQLLQERSCCVVI